MPVITESGMVGGVLTGEFLNDCYGSLTQTAGTVITRTIPPNSGGRACIGWLSYDCSTTAHTLTVMVAMSEVAASSEAASGQAVVNLSSIPTAFDGSILAANDFMIVQHEDGSWNEYKVSSLSGLAVTFSSNLTGKVLKSSRIFFMGAPADHTTRRFTMKASTITTLVGGDFRIHFGASTLPNQPLLVHSDNSTAAGTLTGLAYYYD